MHKIIIVVLFHNCATKRKKKKKMISKEAHVAQIAQLFTAVNRGSDGSDRVSLVYNTLTSRNPTSKPLLPTHTPSLSQALTKNPRVPKSNPLPPFPLAAATRRAGIPHHAACLAPGARLHRRAPPPRPDEHAPPLRPWTLPYRRESASIRGASRASSHRRVRKP
jgi:hypothetical protein